MDFLEGFLLGPVWSDTEYETRRHTGFYWLLGWLSAGLYLWLLLYPDQSDRWLIIDLVPAVFLAVFFLLALPFANRFYYKVHFAVKIPILAAHIVKLTSLLMIILHIALSLYRIERELLPDQLLEYVNQTIEKATEYFEMLGRVLGMLLGIVSGGLIIVGSLIGLVLIATLVPVIVLVLFKALQRLVDELVHRYVFHGAE